MGKRQAPGVGFPSKRGPGHALLWCLLWLLAAAAMYYVAGRLFGHTPYRIDIDIYQMGGQ
ncbi:MAG TPA: alpha-(1-2)-phosphatidylinositol mannosyltransferase, partial [Mycobacterium sp.]|nr:alpha-(1-2)-phosphatidylinositol mannosyltransferase [Mycobacterium sp.]